MSAYFDQSISKVKEFEGSVAWMYLDTEGNVTVGAGLLLPDATAACALPFVLAGSPATRAQITAEFARVAALELGELPRFYRTDTSPELPQAAIDANLRSILTEFETTLREKLPSYDQLPDGVKMALLDMAYNLGPEGLLNGYPHMLAAVETGAWGKAAAECSRGGISNERNAWTRQGFLSSVVGTIRAGVIAEVGAEIKAVEEKPRSWFARTFVKPTKPGK